jgi:hypothetical protein
MLKVITFVGVFAGEAATADVEAWRLALFDEAGAAAAGAGRRGSGVPEILIRTPCHTCFARFTRGAIAATDSVKRAGVGGRGVGLVRPR